jgi:protein-tyrosine phosphatase
VAYDVDEQEDRRWVALEGAFNFRDLGGYATGDGTRVRAGMVFRADALNHSSPDDLRVLEALGVDRIIDLRSPEEIGAVGRGLLADGPIEYVTASVIPMAGGEAVGAPSGDDIAERYLWYLDIGRDAFVSAFEVLSEEGRGAVVFHCAAGKDRTGVLAALLLSVLGVGADDIVADYALTNRAMPSILERLANDPIVGPRVMQIPPGRVMAPPETMGRFLELLDTRHGGAQAWLEQAGVPPRSIAGLRSSLRV